MFTSRHNYVVYLESLLILDTIPYVSNLQPEDAHISEA